MLPVAAIVLAAGSSVRMGRPKQLLELGGEPLVRRAARTALAAGADDVIVVTPPGLPAIGAALADLGVRIVENAGAANGMSTSIVRALESIGDGAAALFTLCDQPLVSPEHLAGVIAAHRADPERIVATRYGGVDGVPALFPVSFFAELRRLTGDRGARSVIDAHRGRVVSIVFEPAAVDVDTIEDYRRL